MKTMDAQRLRNLTTGRLHTEMGHIYEDLGFLTGQDGLMTHMLPRALRACIPWLKANVKGDRFWDDRFDKSHVGTIEIPEPTSADREAMFELYKQQPNPLAGKEVMAVVV